MDLSEKAKEIRRTILETALKAGKGHIPPALSWVEIGVMLYYGMMKIDPHNPKLPERDRFILSKGHGCLTLYAILADLGFFPKAELDNFCRGGAMLAGHPDTNIPGVEFSTGSLGHGLGVACGMALSAKLDKKPWRTFVLLGDGECQEGSVWEALAFAKQQRLGNLVIIVDNNKLAATQRLSGDLLSQLIGYGLWTRDVDGHDLDALKAALTVAPHEPIVVIADTIKGHGIPFMENSVNWHHQIPKGEQIEEARKALA
ncbi:MAG: transketolase [Patescibacteria group bacterium]|nr:transketolase [Patescibacteria group bacterium]